MRTLAERHKRAGQIAEALRQYDHAAHEYFQAHRHYRAEGRNKEAEAMTALERRALSQMILLSDSAREFETQAFKLASHVSNTEVADDSVGELRSLAASLYEEAANRYEALAHRVITASRKPHFLRKAASDLQFAAALESAQGEALAARARRLDEEASRSDCVAGPSEESAPSEVALAWLRRLARPRCRVCERLWQDYASSSSDPTAAGALLDHEAAHEWKSAQNPPDSEVFPAARI
jgi:hypothetical protein